MGPAAIRQACVLIPANLWFSHTIVSIQELFNKLVSLTEEARKAYKDMVSALEQEQAEEALKNVKKVPHHMGHSRNPSAASAISFCSVISEPISEVNEKEYGETFILYFWQESRYLPFWAISHCMFIKLSFYLVLPPTLLFRNQLEEHGRVLGWPRGSRERQGAEQ